MVSKFVLTTCLFALVIPSTLSAETLVVEKCKTSWKDQVSLAADRPGILVDVPSREGERLAKDAVAAKLDDRVARAAYNKAAKQATNTVDFEFAQKNKALAEAELLKNQLANADFEGLVAEIEIKRLKLAVERAKLQEEQAVFQQRLDKLAELEAEAALAQYKVVAPFAGMVVKVHKLPGAAVVQGDPIVEVINTDVIRVEGLLDLSALQKVRRGAKVTFRCDSIDAAPCEGKVILVDLYKQPIKPWVKVIAEVSNVDGVLIAGLNGTLEIDTSTIVESSDKQAANGPQFGVDRRK